MMCTEVADREGIPLQTGWVVNSRFLDRIRISMDPALFELMDPDPDPGGQK
jgi:hypothetical protein